MDYKIMSAVYYREAKLSQHEVSVLMCLACAAKDDKSLPSPSLRRIADRAGMSVRNVSRTVQGLTAKGLLKVAKRQTASGQWCNLYKIETGKLGAQQPQEESEYKSGKGSNMDSRSNMDGGKKSSEEVQRVAKSGGESNNNNIVNNIDNNKDNRQASIESNIEPRRNIPPPTPQTPQGSPAACKDKPFTLKELALEARTKLIEQGMSQQDAETRLKAVSEDFKAAVQTLKAGGYAGISNRRKYLLAKLVGMAMDYKPSTKSAQAPAPTDREGIISAVTEYFKGVYPDQAQHIADWMQDAPNWIWTKFNGLMDARFDGRNPVTATENIFRNWMTEQNNYASQPTASDIKDMERISTRKAEREAMVMVLRGEL